MENQNPYVPPASPYAPPTPQTNQFAQPVQTAQPVQQLQSAQPPQSSIPNQQSAGVYPPAPAPSGYGYPGSAPQRGGNNNKKKLIVFGAVIGGIIALAGGGTFAYSQLNSVSAEDYKLATTASTDLESKLRNVNYDATTVSSLDTAEKNQEALAKAKTAISDYEKAAETFKTQKALRDSEISNLYKQYETKSAPYIKSVKVLNADLEKALPALTRCQNDTSSRADATTASKKLDECVSGLNALTGLQDPNMKLIVDAMKELAQTGSSTLKKYQQANASRNYAEASKLYNAYFTAQNTAIDKADEADKAMRKAFDSTDPSKELQALTNKLSTKSFEG